MSVVAKRPVPAPGASPETARKIPPLVGLILSTVYAGSISIGGESIQIRI